MNPTFRSLALLSATVLGTSLTACATTPASPPMSTPLPPPTDQCRPEPAQSLVGQPATPANVELARQRSGARVARVIPHDRMVTMEYMEGRLNIYTDPSNVILRIGCG